MSADSFDTQAFLALDTRQKHATVANIRSGAAVTVIPAFSFYWL